MVQASEEVPSWSRGTHQRTQKAGVAGPMPGPRRGRLRAWVRGILRVPTWTEGSAVLTSPPPAQSQPRHSSLRSGPAHLCRRERIPSRGCSASDSPEKCNLSEWYHQRAQKTSRGANRARPPPLDAPPPSRRLSHRRGGRCYSPSFAGCRRPRPIGPRHRSRG